MGENLEPKVAGLTPVPSEWSTRLRGLTVILRSEATKNLDSPRSATPNGAARLFAQVRGSACGHSFGVAQNHGKGER